MPTRPGGGGCPPFRPLAQQISQDYECTKGHRLVGAQIEKAKGRHRGPGFFARSGFRHRAPVFPPSIITPEKTSVRRR
jgi:hypothetical protein